MAAFKYNLEIDFDLESEPKIREIPLIIERLLNL